VLGGVAERLNAAVSKTVMGLSVHREFESLPLRSGSGPGDCEILSARGRRGLSPAAGALMALAALAPGAAAGYPVADGTLTLEERRTPAVLTRAGIDIRPVLLAPARAGVVRRMEGPADLLVLFQNPIRISSRARRIQVTDVRLRLRGVGAAMLLGRVRGVFMPIFELERSGMTREYAFLTGGYHPLLGRGHLRRRPERDGGCHR
jgi:hypothetical protein